MKPWTCAECQSQNRPKARFCDDCGSARNAALSAPTAERSAEFTAPWDRPGWKPSRPEDPCTEPGCTKTVRDHIEEFRAIVSRPGTVFTRPSRSAQQLADDEALERRRQALLAQAALLRITPPVPF